MVERTPKDEGLRAQAAVLLSQARSEMLDIKHALSQIRDNGLAQSRLSAAAAQIADAVAQVSGEMHSSSGSLSAIDLTALASAVQSADVGALVGEASAQPGGGSASLAAANVAAASATTRAEVESLSKEVFDQHIFDPYLRFSSPEDEAAFRAHEASVKKYVDAQLARGTAEGNLNAGGGMMDYMLDAQAHGAGDSPDFMPRMNKLVADTKRQRAAMMAAGQSTQEFDRNLNTQVHSFLKAKGLSDSEIDARLSGAASLQDALKPFLQSGSGFGNLRVEVQRAEPPAAASSGKPGVGASPTAPTRDGQLTIDFAAMDAKLRAAGLKPVDNTVANTGHGLGVQKPAGQGGRTPGD